MWSGRAVPSTTSLEITTSATPSRLGRSNMVSSRMPSHAQIDAFVADVDSWAGNKLAQLALALAAERAIERALGIAAAGLAHL